MSGGFSAVTAGLAAVAPYMAAASGAMTILGGIQGQAGANAAGQTAYQNALIRNEVAEREAAQMRANAIEAEATGQRGDIEAQRQGDIMASRARAVMAASGAGVDPKLTARLVGAGVYKGQVAEFNSESQATQMRDQANMTEWGGKAGVQVGQATKSADEWAGSNTLLSSIGKGVLSIAQKYGTGAATPASPYSLSADTARTAGDADLGGYNRSQVF